MRFPIHVFFLDHRVAVVRRCLAVPPRRVLCCRAADIVLELSARGERLAGAAA
jgi:hypothetical protein